MSGSPGAALDTPHTPITYETLTAAADNGTGSTVSANAVFVYVAAVATDANDWITLPAGPPIGTVIRGWSLIAHELRTLASSNVKINDVDSDGTQEAAIPATTLWEATYVSTAQGWILRAWTELGAVITAIIPD